MRHPEYFCWSVTQLHLRLNSGKPMKLKDLKKFETAKIVSVHIESQQVAHRLADLGLQKDQLVTCLHGSPWGGVNSYQLSNGVFALEDWICENVNIKPVEEVSP